jgi:hypothetical protein
LRLCHEDKITFYGPIEVSARWGNQPHWHQMTVQDLTMTIDQFHKGIDAVKPVGSASHNLETDDAIQGPKFHLTLSLRGRLYCGYCRGGVAGDLLAGHDQGRSQITLRQG